LPTTTVRFFLKSRTATLPAVTLTTVASLRSNVNQVVPLIVADA
jgi:hypothetical protein